MKILIVVAMALLLGGCAHKPGTGSIADSATTYAVLAQGGTELNPIIGWSGDPVVTVITALGVKQGAKYGIEQAGVERCQAHRYVELGGWFGGGWNLAVLAGATSPAAPVIGLAAAVIYFQVSGSLCDHDSTATR